MSQKERTLEVFVHDQWLCLTSGGRIGLRVRSFLDLRSCFHDNEVPTCQVCNEATVKAKLCQNEGCKIRMHQCCLKKLFSVRGVIRLCPGCGTQWPLVAKSEAAEEQVDDQGGASGNTLPPDSSSRKRPKTSKGVYCGTQEPSSSVTFGKRRLT